MGADAVVVALLAAAVVMGVVGASAGVRDGWLLVAAAIATGLVGVVLLGLTREARGPRPSRRPHP